MSPDGSPSAVAPDNDGSRGPAVSPAPAVLPAGAFDPLASYLAALAASGAAAGPLAAPLADSDVYFASLSWPFPGGLGRRYDP